jgi:anion-transporting  ArsA/GET3 family ATPase
VKLVGRTYQWWVKSPLAKLGKSSFELYTKVEELLGAKLVHQVLDFFSVFRGFAEGYAARAQETLTMLRDPATTSFIIVTTPAKAARDGEHFLAELTNRRFPVGSLVVNRTWPDMPQEVPPGAPPQAREMADWYESVCQSHRKISESVARSFSERIPRLVSLPELAGDLDGLEALHRMVEKME